MSFPTDLEPVPMVPQFSYYHLTAVGIFGITDFLSRLSKCYWQADTTQAVSTAFWQYAELLSMQFNDVCGYIFKQTKTDMCSFN
jgi:hypothetical protein